jgi:nitrilase
VHGDDPEAVMIRGGSCIVNPFGEIFAGPSYGAQSILTADLDLDDVVRGKYDLDVVGHYARSDIFRLHVNERATPAVVSDSGVVMNASDVRGATADRAPSASRLRGPDPEQS